MLTTVLPRSPQKYSTRVKITSADITQKILTNLLICDVINDIISGSVYMEYETEWRTMDRIGRGRKSGTISAHAWTG